VAAGLRRPVSRYCPVVAFLKYRVQPTRDEVLEVRVQTWQAVGREPREGDVTPPPREGAVKPPPLHGVKRGVKAF
jgi:hypothetical protein